MEALNLRLFILPQMAGIAIQQSLGTGDLPVVA